MDGYVRLIPVTHKKEKPIAIITTVDEVHLKCDCNNDSIVNGTREPILYNFGFDKPPGHEIHEEPTIKLFEEINKTILSEI